MYDFIMWTLVCVGVVFLVLLSVIIVGKAWRELVDARLQRLRREMEPAFFKYTVGTGPIQEYLPRPLRRGEHVLVERIFFDLGHVVKGSARDRAREAFEQLGLVDGTLRQLESRRWWYRAEAAEKLGMMGSEKATRALIRHMSDPVAEVRVRVARALGSIRTEEALRPLVTALRDPGRWSAIRVAGILIGAGDDAAMILLEEFADMPPHAKIAAIDVFGRIRSLRAINLLRELMRDAAPDIRARAAYALGNIGDPTSAGLLAEALVDKEWAVRAMAAKALGRLREESSIDALCRALGDQQWWVRANAAEALKNKGERGIKALLDMLESRDSYAAHQAVQRLQESAVLDALIAQLGSSRDDERQQALEVMAKLVKLRRTDLLTEMARNHPNTSIRQRLAIILGLNPEPSPVS